MLGYYLQAYIIRQTDSKASSTVCSLLISGAQSTWHLRGSVRKPSSLHTLGMTIASSHTSSFMADDLRSQFSSVFRARPAAASCEWKLNETREKHFTIFIFCCTSLSLKPPLVENLIWARLRAFRNCSAGTGLSVAESRLVYWSNSWPAMRRENSCSSCRYHFVIDHLVGFLVFAGELKPALPIKFTAIRRMLTHGGGGFSDCDIVQQQLILRLLLKPIAKSDEGCCSARSLIARSLRTWTWWIDGFWSPLKGKLMRAI